MHRNRVERAGAAAAAIRVFERRHILTGCQGTVRGAVSIGPLGAVGVWVLLEEQTDVEEARKALGTTLLDCLNMVEWAEKLITF